MKSARPVAPSGAAVQPTTSRQAFSGSAGAAVLLLLMLAGLTGCGPGSGGSGIPDSAATSSPLPVAPPPTDSACASAVNGWTDAAAYSGTVRAVDAGCLLVGERGIRLDGTQIVGRSGAALTLADLAAGTLVTVEPRVDQPSTAASVIVEGR